MESETKQLDPDFLAILRCPISHEPLIQKGDRLICVASKKAYPIIEGIPSLLKEEATELTETEIADLKAKNDD